jgi:hypothetical protein
VNQLVGHSVIKLKPIGPTISGEGDWDEVGKASEGAIAMQLVGGPSLYEGVIFEN